MGEYSVLFYCDECCEVHPLGMSVKMDHGPTNRTRACDLYVHKDIEPDILRMKQNTTTCPNTGKLTSQKDDRQLFLIPL